MSADSIELRLQLSRTNFVLDVALRLPARGVSAIFRSLRLGQDDSCAPSPGWNDARAVVSTLPARSGSGTARPASSYHHKRSLGCVFQDAALFPHLSVRENLAFGRRRGDATPPDAAAVVFDRISVRCSIAVRTVSGGAAAGCHRPCTTREAAPAVDGRTAGRTGDEQRKAEFLPWLETLHDELDIRCFASAMRCRKWHDWLTIWCCWSRVACAPRGRLPELLPRLDLPLSHGEEAFVVIPAAVGAYDADYALARLDFAGQSLWAPSAPRIPGAAVRVRIQARDVSLALAPMTIQASSIRFPRR